MIFSVFLAAHVVAINLPRRTKTTLVNWVQE